MVLVAVFASLVLSKSAYRDSLYPHIPAMRGYQLHYRCPSLPLQLSLVAHRYCCFSLLASRATSISLDTDLLR